MKFTITILFLCLVLLQGRSQTYNYIPLVDSGIVWSGYSEICTMGNCWPNRWRFHLSGDTTLSNRVYQRISSDYGTVGFIREDSTKKVYYKSALAPADLEKTIYDFSLNLGDTLFLDTNFVFIKSVDTITYFGTQRRTLLAEYSLLYNGHPWQEVWIEGLGSTYIPLTILGTDSRYHSTTQNIRVCSVSIHDEIQYQVTSGWCNVSDVSRLLSVKSIPFFPNPASSFITFDLTNCNAPFVFQVYNLIGEIQLEEKENSASQQYTLFLDQYPAGIYFLKIFENEGKTQTLKFVKVD